MSTKIYPIGIQNFEKIRNDGYLYIDKTAYPRIHFFLILFSIPQALAPKESRGEHPVRLCDPSYFVTPEAQIAV